MTLRNVVLTSIANVNPAKKDNYVSKGQAQLASADGFTHALFNHGPC
jgi:hypothetical protein